MVILRKQLHTLQEKSLELISSVPVRIKIAGIALLPVLVLGFALNYWIQTGLSDWLSYLLTDTRVAIAMQNGGRSVLFVTALAAAASFLLTFLMTLFLTRPLIELRQVAQRVTAGDLTSRVTVWSNDEIGEVASAMNTMIDQLVVKQQKLENRNQHLQVLNKVAVATSRELVLQDVLDAALKATLAAMHLESGWVYLRDLDNYKFRLASMIAVSPQLENLIREQRETPCACQAALLDGKLGHGAVAQRCTRMVMTTGNEQLAAGHLIIPLEARGQQFGIINLLCPADMNPRTDDIELLSTIGVQVSELVANAWLHARLVEKETARQALLSALVSAEEDERARLARELHDDAGQTLTSLLIRLKGLEKYAEADKVRYGINDLCQAVSETIQQISQISYRLRPAALEEFGLEVALSSLLRDVIQETGLTTESHLELNGRRLPFEVETTLYRIAQEGLTNIVRHANAQKIHIELQVLPYAICMRLEDDGIGFDPETIPHGDGEHRLGLIGMQERAEMMGGSLIVETAPNAGTSVHVRIPIQQEELT